MLNATNFSHSSTETPLGIMSFNDVSLIPELAFNMSDKELELSLKKEIISSCSSHFGCACDSKCPLACPQYTP